VYPAQNKAVQPSKGQYGHVTDVAKLHPPTRGKKAFSWIILQKRTCSGNGSGISSTKINLSSNDEDKIIFYSMYIFFD
jgi:hypothetical protein